MSDKLQPEDKLKALGLKLTESQESPLRDEFDALENAVSGLSNGFTEFQNDVSNEGSFDNFENYMTNDLGLTSTEASRLRQKFEAKYGDYNTFDTEVNSFSTFDAWRNSFVWGDTIGGETTSDGETRNAGIRIHSEDGITRDDVAVPAGAVEVFAPEIHFSQTGATVDEDPDKSSVFSWSNMSASETTINPGDTITLSADLTNNGSYPENYTPALIIDDATVKTADTITVDANATQTVSFSRTFDDLGVFDVRISKSSTVQVSVVPPNLN